MSPLQSIPRLFQLTARLYAAMTDFLSGKLDGVNAVFGGELMVWFRGSIAGLFQTNKQSANCTRVGQTANVRTRAVALKL